MIPNTKERVRSTLMAADPSLTMDSSTAYQPPAVYYHQTSAQVLMACPTDRLRKELGLRIASTSEPSDSKPKQSDSIASLDSSTVQQSTSTAQQTSHLQNFPLQSGTKSKPMQCATHSPETGVVLPDGSHQSSFASHPSGTVLALEPATSQPSVNKTNSCPLYAQNSLASVISRPAEKFCFGSLPNETSGPTFNFGSPPNKPTDSAATSNIRSILSESITRDTYNSLADSKDSCAIGFPRFSRPADTRSVSMATPISMGPQVSTAHLKLNQPQHSDSSQSLFRPLETVPSGTPTDGAKSTCSPSVQWLSPPDSSINSVKSEPTESKEKPRGLLLLLEAIEKQNETQKKLKKPTSHSYEIFKEKNGTFVLREKMGNKRRFSPRMSCEPEEKKTKQNA